MFMQNKSIWQKILHGICTSTVIYFKTIPHLQSILTVSFKNKVSFNIDKMKRLYTILDDNLIQEAAQ